MKSARIWLTDMADAIHGIEQTLAGADFEAFAQSWTLQRAVERGLEIISEASRRLPDDAKAAHPEVAWPQIAGIGNILRHEYHRIEPAIVWNITGVHLQNLSTAVEALLKEGT